MRIPAPLRIILQTTNDQATALMEMAAEMLSQRQMQFSALLEQHQAILFKVAHSYCADPHQREDMVQEIAAQLWKAFPSYDPARKFSTWMYRIALNVAISQLRSTSTRQQHQLPFVESQHEPSIEGPDPVVNEQLRTLQRFMNSVDPLNRALLLLYLEAHTSAEIADVLGISETNVSTRLSRLKQRIRAS